jgi:NAD(P)-dependent dehydrogenase (short-subunit alcohol dehydrogenase family)
VALSIHDDAKEHVMTDLNGLGYRGATVVVTGGSSGMGASTARILGELGAEVHTVDLNQRSVPSERLGHASPAFPLAVYQHVLPGMHAEAVRAFAALIVADE